MTYFDADLTENEIDIADNPQKPFNEVGRGPRQGVEVAARTDLGSGLSLGAAYTYLNARKPDNSEAIRRPPHSGRIDVNYAFLNKGNVNFAIAYTGQQDDFAFRELPFFATAQERVTLDSFWLATVAANYRVAPGWILRARRERVQRPPPGDLGLEVGADCGFAGVRLTYEEAQTVAWANGK